MAINDIVQTIAEARVDARSLSEFVFKPAGFKVARRLAPTVDTLQFYIDKFDSTVESVTNNAINTVNDAINNTAIEGGILADTFVVVDGNQNQRDVNQKSARTFTNVANMVADTKLKEGQFTRTQNFHTGGDRGGRHFTVSATEGILSIPLANGLHAIPSLGLEITSMDLGIARGANPSTSELLRIPPAVTKVSLIDCTFITDSEVNVVGSGNLELEFINSTLQDSMQAGDPLVGAPKSILVFYGLRFSGFNVLRVTNIEFKWGATLNTHPVSVEQARIQRPMFEVRDTNKVYFNGLVNAFMSSYATQEIGEDIYQTMACFPVVFFKCGYVNTDKTVVGNNISGEMIGFNKCDHVDFVGVSHNQGVGRTFWSLAKIIDCGHIYMNHIDCDSKSVGSLIDLLGRTVHIGSDIKQNSTKSFDISSEWAKAEVQGCDYVYVERQEYSKPNPTGAMIFNSIYNVDGFDTITHRKVHIEEIKINKRVPVVVAIPIQLSKTESVFIGEIDGWDVGRVQHRNTDGTGNVPYKKLVIDRLTINRSEGGTAKTIIDAEGLAQINSGTVTNSYILFQNLSAVDITGAVALQKGYVTYVRNVVFNNTQIETYSNIKFINCTFQDSYFTHREDSTSAEIVFEDCKIVGSYSTKPFLPRVSTVGGIVKGDPHITFKACDIDLTGTGVQLEFASKATFTNSSISIPAGKVVTKSHALVLDNCTVNTELELATVELAREHKLNILNSYINPNSTLTISTDKHDVTVFNSGVPAAIDALLITPSVKTIKKQGSYTND